MASVSGASPQFSTLARMAVPSALKPEQEQGLSAQGLADGAAHRLGKLANHTYHAVKHIQPARAAVGAVPGAVFGSGSVLGALKGLGGLLGRTGAISGLVSAAMSGVVHFLRVKRGEEDVARATKLVAIDTAAGVAGGAGAALFSGVAAATLGALGLAGWPLTLAGAIAGFVGFSYGDNWVRSKVYQFLDWLNYKRQR